MRVTEGILFETFITLYDLVMKESADKKAQYEMAPNWAYMALQRQASVAAAKDLASRRALIRRSTGRNCWRFIFYVTFSNLKKIQSPDYNSGETANSTY